MNEEDEVYYTNMSFFKGAVNDKKKKKKEKKSVLHYNCSNLGPML